MILPDNHLLYTVYCELPDINLDPAGKRFRPKF